MRVQKIWISFLLVAVAVTVLPRIATAADEEETEQPPGAPMAFVVTSDGRIIPVGGDGSVPATAPIDGVNDVVGYEEDPAGGGYLSTSTGRVISLGGAPAVGDIAHIALNAPVIAADRHPDGGIGLFASDGGVFALNGLRFSGSVAALNLDEPIVDGIITPSGNGTVLLARDGGVFNNGDAIFVGSRAGRLDELAGANGVPVAPIGIRFPTPADQLRGVQYPSQIVTYDNGMEEVFGAPGGGVAVLGSGPRYSLPHLKLKGSSDGAAFDEAGNVYLPSSADPVELDLNEDVDVVDMYLPSHLRNAEPATIRFDVDCSVDGEPRACDHHHDLLDGQELNIDIAAHYDSPLLPRGPGGEPGVDSQPAPPPFPLSARSGYEAVLPMMKVNRLFGGLPNPSALDVPAHRFSFVCDGPGNGSGRVAVEAGFTFLGDDDQVVPKFVYEFAAACSAKPELDITCGFAEGSRGPCNDMSLATGQSVTITASGEPSKFITHTSLTVTWDGSNIVQLAPNPSPPNDTVVGAVMSATIACAVQDGATTLVGAKGTVTAGAGAPSRTVPFTVTCLAPLDDEPMLPPPPQTTSLSQPPCFQVEHLGATSRVTVHVTAAGSPSAVQSVTVTMSGAGLQTPTASAQVAENGVAAVKFPITSDGRKTVTKIVVTLADGTNVDVTADAPGAHVDVELGVETGC